MKRGYFGVELISRPSWMFLAADIDAAGNRREWVAKWGKTACNLESPAGNLWKEEAATHYELMLCESGGGRTRIELFVQYLSTWESNVRRHALEFKR